MPGPLQAAGAISNPTRYAALTMQGEQFTGAYTQRSPYRDAATAYLVKKFYGGSRFDSIWDGINREITAKLTDGRRPGSVIYNANVIPPVNSYYSWKYIQDGIERVRVLADNTDGSIRDITAGQVAVLMTKSGGAGRARFMNLGSELFIGDGVDQQKILDGKITWHANTNVAPGTLISTGSPATMQMALGGITMNVLATASNGVFFTVWVDPATIPQQFPNLYGVSLTFAGLTSGAFLNGTTHTGKIISTTLGILQFAIAHGAYNETPDTGTITTGTGITGGGAPVFSTVQFAVVADGGQQWKCYGPAQQNWGMPAPISAPAITPAFARFWQANTTLSLNYAILDGNQNLQVALGLTAGSAVYKTGRSYPAWTPATTAIPNPQTVDGTIIWTNLGKIGQWAAATVFAKNAVILDSNQNLQYVTAGGGGASGGGAPVWSTVTGTTTADGALTWTCLGFGVVLTTSTIQYAFATHAIDGSISTASPALTVVGPILGISTTIIDFPTAFFTLGGAFVQDSQIDQIYIYRTAQGQSTLILEDQLPTDIGAGTFTYFELGVTDTSTNGNGALNPFIQAAIAHLNDPPPAGLTGPVYHLGRTWGFVGNTVRYSNGPDTISTTSNGQTGFPPLNVATYQAGVVKLVPITVQNGGLLVFTTSGIFIILGTGTASNPFYSTQFCNKINLAGYDALDVFGTEIFLMEANAKVSSLAIEYPFNPQSGYTEVGFPIGDQFKKVTTGGFNATMFAPATTYLSWNVQGSGETAMYVANGGGQWFRMSVVSPPETGLLWSPIASIAAGSSAVQSVETAPGVFDLLIGPISPGPILKRDTTGAVWGDNGASYSSWDAKGVNLLCSTGQSTEVAHISTKSAAVGARPTISVLLGEIAPTLKRPWTVLEVTSPDPPESLRSQSVFSDRYSLAQCGAAMTGDCILTKFDYGTQAVADELLDWGIFATTEDERKEEAQK